jgi:hypothetical protein
MSIIANDASVIFESAYNYDSSVTLDDNINIFLSRCGLSVKHSGYSFSAISVLYADTERIDHIENIFYRAQLPTIRQQSIISQAIYEILRKTPETHLTISDAICETIRYNVNNTGRLNGASYIFVGSRLHAFHAHSDSSKTVCSPEKLLTNDEKRILQHPHLSRKEDIDALFIKLSEFMDAAFSPSAITLESDLYIPDEITVQIITRAFTLSGKHLPLINVISHHSKDPIYLHGILQSTIFATTKRYITNT